MATIQEQLAKLGLTANHNAAELSMILVMGITGSGKSYFINRLSGQKIVDEGADLTSCTQKCQLVPMDIGLTKTLFIDTPGFDDTARTDAEILAEITTILTLQHETGILLKGIIYIHRISDIRFGRSAVKTLEIFQKLCGKDALKNVLLVTSRWQDIDQQTGVERERQLREKFWSFMLRSGSNMSRFHGDRDSAVGLVSQLLAKESIVLEIQREISSGRTLDQTAAGSYVSDDIEKLKAQHEEEIQSLNTLKSQLRSSEVGMREQVQHELDEERAKLKLQERRQSSISQDILSGIRGTLRMVIKSHSLVALPLVSLSLDIIGAFVEIPPTVYTVMDLWSKAAGMPVKARQADASDTDQQPFEDIEEEDA
ncbi:hypothetical protein SLS53_005928 [Cytospora paraplurivora]|uniref:AIG1-type G domain-containing protein n=1 Tax=Cytospora paraplurivora TaxID=2898453 RepID=A0AAN9YFP8_9PEZI